MNTIVVLTKHPCSVVHFKGAKEAQREVNEFKHATKPQNNLLATRLP